MRPATLFLVSVALHAQTFQPAPWGCAMAHCDAQMSDNARLFPPMSANAYVRFHDTLPPGSGIGLGCSSNGRIAVCSYKSTSGNAVIAYKPDGTRLWTSGNLLNSSANASAPMVNAFGGVIATDDTRVVRFSGSGAVMWNTLTPGGTPISPVVTENGSVVLATKGGPISAYNSETGMLIGSLYVRDWPFTLKFFETVNTPCVIGNRVYVSMAKKDDPNHKAWLAAVDVDPANPAEPLRLAWHFTFGGPSGASPLCDGNTVYFDGDRPRPGDPKEPRMFAVRDDGDQGVLVWSRAAVDSVPASFARDPRGGYWVIYLGHPAVERRSLLTGSLIESIDVSALVGGTAANDPLSAITIAGNRWRPVMIIGAWARTHPSSHVLAIDLAGRNLLWKITLNPTFRDDNAFSQFPIAIDEAGKSVVIFPGRNSGAYFVTDP